MLSIKRSANDMKSTHDDALLSAAKDALDALERLSHGVRFGAMEQLRQAIQDSENERRRASVPLSASPPACERRTWPEP
jgi:hypothetical protein